MTTEIKAEIEALHAEKSKVNTLIVKVRRAKAYTNDVEYAALIDPLIARHEGLQRDCDRLQEQLRIEMEKGLQDD